MGYQMYYTRDGEERVIHAARKMAVLKRFCEEIIANPGCIVDLTKEQLDDLDNQVKTQRANGKKTTFAGIDMTTKKEVPPLNVRKPEDKPTPRRRRRPRPQQ